MSRKPGARRRGGAGRKRTAAKKRGWLRIVARWLMLVVVGLVLAGLLYGVYLDQVVRSRFEGKRWSLPARVYARPMELYAGRVLSADSLKAELDRLGYTRTRHPDRPGAYSYYKERFLLRSRPFRFWDGEEASHYLEVRFAGDRITSLKRAADGADLALARLDAVLIDSIYPDDNEDRVVLSRKELPDLLVRTLLTVEDRQFYEHRGVDPLAILRALWSNLRAGRLVQGGSTLTQQLVKNFYLTSERTLTRKVNEAFMSLLLDYRYSKDEILEAYANEIYLGQDGNRAIHGFGLAARFYFNRPLAELDLPETALLVGMIRGPSYYNPRRHPERARARRDRVLDMLARQGVISAESAAAAQQAGLGVSTKGGRPAGRYPAFMQLVREQLKRDYRTADLQSEGLHIFTTLDPGLQDLAERVVASRLDALERAPRVAGLEAAAVLASPENGEVLALVGGRRSGYSGFNRALEAVRPIGSLIKPVVYLEALDRAHGYTPVTPLDDGPVRLKAGDGRLWQPNNFDGRSHGRPALYQSLVHSYNLATVHLGLDLGVPRVARRLSNLGLKRRVQPVPALLLGSVSLTPLEVTQLYQVFASGGFRTPLRAVREVLDASGRPLSRYALNVRQVADPASVYLLNWTLRQVVEQGTGKGLGRLLPAGLQVAGKTGTTDDYRDSWFAGFSGDKVGVVWVGRDDNKPAGLSGATGAMTLWGDIIAGSDSQSWAVPPPRGVEWIEIDPASGLRAGAGCDAAVAMPFRKGSGPRDAAPCAAPAADSSGFIWDFLQ